MATKVESLETLVHLATSKQGGNDAFCDLDFVQPEIANPDEIFVGNDPNVVQFCKRLGSDLLVLQEIRTGRKKLALLSMWKRPLSAPVAPHLNASTAEASAEGEPSAPFGERAN